MIGEANKTKVNHVELESNTASIKARKATATIGVLKVITSKDPPKRDRVNNPLTADQRKKIDDWIAEWCATSNLKGKPLYFGQAVGRMWKSALNGEVNGMDQIEQVEFDACKAYLKQQIKIAEEGNKEARKKTSWRPDRIGSIQGRCKKLGVSDLKRKKYMDDRFKVDSLTKLSDTELEQFYRYVLGDNPSFNYREEANPRDRELMTKALEAWVSRKNSEAMERGESFDPQAMRIPKKDIRAELEAENRQIFGPLTVSAFNHWWAEQKICKCLAGRKAGSTKAQP